MEESDHPRLIDVLPDLAAEISEALLSVAPDEHLYLAPLISDLRIWGRCRCDDAFCSSFYTGQTQARPWSSYGDHFNALLLLDRGTVVLDVVDRVIRFVEVLDRPDIKHVIDTFPKLEKPDID